jgi:hypothetical protein
MPSKKRKQRMRRRSLKKGKKSNHAHRAMYGSRFTTPFCPGISTYVDDIDIPYSMGKNALGNYVQTGGIGKLCKRPDYEHPGKSINFHIDEKGNCYEEDKSKCATSVAGAVGTIGNVAVGIGKVALNTAITPIARTLDQVHSFISTGDFTDKGSLEGMLDDHTGDGLNHIKNSNEIAKVQIAKASRIL